MTLQESAVSHIVQDYFHDPQRNSDTSLASRSISIGRPDFSPSQFVSSRGNEYYCEIDEDYLTDRFNLTGLNTEVQYYQYALDLVTDVFDMEVDDDMREQIEKSARHLYGLVHARYIVTTRGLAKMVRHRSSSCSSIPADDQKARQVQVRHLWQMPSRNLRPTTSSTHGSPRRPRHINRKALLRQM
jgi:hypothetical protein